MKDRYLSVAEVCEILGKKQSYCSQLVKKLNDELKENGYLTNSGKIPKNYFCRRHHLDPNDFN